MDQPTKVVGRRVLAFVIDWAIGFGVYVGMVMALGERFETFDSGFRIETINDTTAVQIGDNAWLLDGGKFGVVALVAAGWWIFNLCILTGTTGASIGKLVAGIRVVRPDGAVCGIGKAFLRWLLLIVDAFPYFAPLVGFVTVLATEGNRRVGDMAAGTFVVRASAVGRPVSAGAAPGPYATMSPPPGPPASDAQWDAARGAWIRWDGNAWYGHDPSTGAWRPL